MQSLDDADYDAARDSAAACLALDHTRSQCWHALVASFTRRGRLEEAHPHVVDCLREEPGNQTCLSAMMTWQVSHRELDGARTTLDALTATAPDSASMHLAAAEYAQANADEAGACTHFRAACDRGQPYACNRYKALCATEE